MKQNLKFKKDIEVVGVFTVESNKVGLSLEKKLDIGEMFDKKGIEVLSREAFYEPIGELDEGSLLRKAGCIYTALLICTPVGILLLCAYGKGSKGKKAIISIIMFAINIGILILIILGIKSLIK